MPDDGSVTLEDVTSKYACIGMWGPKSREILSKVAQADISDEGFRYMTARYLTIGSVPVLASRVTYVGELGWEFYCSMEYGLQLWDTLWEAGQSEGLVAAGYKAIESLRIEKGYRYWSGEISPDYTPLEAGLKFAVDFDKPDFIGRQAIAVQNEKGLKQCLVCMILADNRVIALGKEPIRPLGTEQIIGWVATGGYGYSVEQSIVYAYLPIDYTKPGTEMEIEFFGERVRAEVVQSPLYDPRGERIRA
jgi:4-methylaminobutanoate oxidase (formaldehyde-forming)